MPLLAPVMSAIFRSSLPTYFSLDVICVRSSRPTWTSADAWSPVEVFVPDLVAFELHDGEYRDLKAFAGRRDAGQKRFVPFGSANHGRRTGSGSPEFNCPY